MNIPKKQKLLFQSFEFWKKKYGKHQYSWPNMWILQCKIHQDHIFKKYGYDSFAFRGVGEHAYNKLEHYILIDWNT